MNYVIKNQRDVYIKLDNGKPVTCGKDQAEEFNYAKAKNILDNLPKTMKKFHFKYQVVQETTHKVNKDIRQEIKNNVIQGNVDYEVTENITQWLDKFGECSDVLDDAKDRQKILIQKLGDIDNELLDILHIIELEPSKNMYHGWLLYKRIKNNRKERRITKDEINIIQDVLEKVDSFWLSRKRIQKAIDGLFKRKYTFRIVEEEEDVKNVV